jgi:hypothetical protein
MKKKEMKKKAAIEFGVTLILTVVLLVILVFIILLLLGIPQKWFKTMPFWSGENGDNGDEPPPKIACPIVIGKIEEAGGFLMERETIFLSGKLTNLTVEEDKIVLISIRGKAEVGKIENGILKIDEQFLDEDSQKYLENKRYLPDFLKLRLLQSSFIYPGGKRYLCISGDLADHKENELMCYNEMRKCSLYNGECKDRPGKNEVSYGKMNCAKGLCYVNITQEKLINGSLEINRTEFRTVEGYGDRFSEINPVKNNVLTVIPGVYQIFYFRIDSEKTNQEFKPFCYILRTDKEVVLQDYFGDNQERSKKLGYSLSAGSRLWSPSNEKTFELIAWDFENQKVYKRVKLNFDKPPRSYADGKIISNENFRSEIVVQPDGTFYVLGRWLIMTWKSIYGDTKIGIREFKIEKKNNHEYYMYGYYKKPGDERERWNLLDCYLDKVVILEDIHYLSVGDLKETLDKTIIENKCDLW